MLPPVGILSLCYNKLYLFENGSLSLINWCDVFRFPLRLLVGSHQIHATQFSGATRWISSYSLHVSVNP